MKTKRTLFLSIVLMMALLLSACDKILIKQDANNSESDTSEMITQLTLQASEISKLEAQ